MVQRWLTGRYGRRRRAGFAAAALLLAAACGSPPPDGDGQDPAVVPGGPSPSSSQASPAARTSPAPTTVETFDGERIHYLRSGERADAGQPALLFVPGWTMPAEIWKPQIEHFARRRLVVAMDPRSQGLSSKARDGHTAAARARDIRAVVETLDLEPVVLVGWSMGVTEVVAYVDAFGTDGVAGLVLVDGVAGQDWTPELALMLLQWMADFVHDRERATREFVRGMYRRPHSDEYLASVVEHALRTPTDAAAALIVAAGRNDFRHTLAEIGRPVLVAATTGSPWDPLYDEMASGLPYGRLEWFDGAGHALFVDEAERFNQLLDEFLGAIDGG